MNQLVISDTNVFIDLHTAGLLDAFFNLPYEIHTTDFVVAEIERTGQRNSVFSFIQKGKLHIEEISAEKMPALIDLQDGNLSLTDCSVWFLAKSKNWILLTGDNRLRKKATIDHVEVHGIFFIFKELVRLSIIQENQAAERLEILSSSNPRLPKEEVEKLLQSWTCLTNKKEDNDII